MLSASIENILRLVATTAVAGCVVSCMSVGPDFNRQTAPLAETWLEENRERIEGVPVDSGAWWKLLNDPVLDSMIAAAFTPDQIIEN